MKLTSPCFKGLLTLISVLIFYTSSAQVGIGTTSPNADALLDIDATTTVGGLLLPRVTLTSTASFAPLSAHVQGMSVYNTATIGDVTPGHYINNGVSWVRQESSPVDSVTLATDQSLTAIAFTDIPGMSITFIARKTTAFVTLTGSGQSTDIAMSLGVLRVFNTTTGTALGGTITNMQTFDNVFGILPAWSLSFSKPLTGLVIGNSYTLRVQGAVDIGVTSGSGPALNISAATFPSSHHLTLSVMH